MADRGAGGVRAAAGEVVVVVSEPTAEELRRLQYASREHRDGRAAAIRTATPMDLCPRCGLPLGPVLLSDPASLHYDHNDERDGYLGLSHGRCDSRAGGLAGARKAREGDWFPVRAW